MRLLQILILSMALLWNITLLEAQSWSESFKALHNDSVSGDKFGQALSIWGDMAVIGAPFNDTASSQFNGKGSVSVYEKSTATNWQLTQTLGPAASGYLPRFGWSLAMDSTTIIVGAPTDATDSSGGNLLNASGAVFVYQKNTSGFWVQTQKLISTDRGTYDYFGWDVSLDGNHLIVGARFESHNANGTDSLGGAGSAYIYERSGNSWIQSQKLVASDRDADDSFGYAVDISGDFALVGAWLEDHDLTGGDSLSSSGAAYIFKRSQTGHWAEVQKLVSPDRGEQELFGCSVALGDSLVVIGSMGDGESDTSGSNYLPSAGTVYLFRLQQNGFWAFHQKLVPSDRRMQDAFGNSLSIDGESLLIGAWQDNPPSAAFNLRHGSAYVFQEGWNRQWFEVEELIASDAADPDRFGQDVGLCNGTALVGAAYKDAERGAAYFFEGSPVVSNQERLNEKPLIFPNPSSDYFHIELSAKCSFPIPYQIIDAQGNSIRVGTLRSASQQIDVGMLNKGMYFLHLCGLPGTNTLKFIRN